jgi:hypothetical protein
MISDCGEKIGANKLRGSKTLVCAGVLLILKVWYPGCVVIFACSPSDRQSEW